MIRRKVGSRGSGKAVIRVFCEGESEQASAGSGQGSQKTGRNYHEAVGRKRSIAG